MTTSAGCATNLPGKEVQNDNTPMDNPRMDSGRILPVWPLCHLVLRVRLCRPKQKNLPGRLQRTPPKPEEMTAYIYPGLNIDPDISLIIKAVEEATGLNYEALCETTRKRHVVFPRMIAAYLIRVNTDLTLKEIALLFKVDHSTIIHYINNLINDSDFKLRLYFNNINLKYEQYKLLNSNN